MKAVAVSAALAIALVVPLSAGTINIGNGATGTNPEGTSGPGDPNLVGNGSDVSVEVQGSTSITDQVLLAILIPNDTTDLFGTTDPLGTITVYPSFPTKTPKSTGSSTFTCTGFGLGSGSGSCVSGEGFWGDFSGSAGTKLSSFLDSNFNSSNNMSNFTGFDASLGVPSLSSVTQYGVYTIALTTGAYSDFGLADIMIPGGLPQGSIVVALADNSKFDSTVWTNAAGVNSTSPVPEPTSLFVIGAGLLAMGLRKAARKGLC